MLEAVNTYNYVSVSIEKYQNLCVQDPHFMNTYDYYWDHLEFWNENHNSYTFDIYILKNAPVDEPVETCIDTGVANCMVQSFYYYYYYYENMRTI